jgi:hypothetical protein
MSSLRDVFERESMKSGAFCQLVEEQVKSELEKSQIKFTETQPTDIAHVILPFSEIRLRQYQSTEDRFARDVAKVAAAKAIVDRVTSLERVTVEIGRDVWHVSFNLVIAMFRNDK